MAHSVVPWYRTISFDQSMKLHATPVCEQKLGRRPPEDGSPASVHAGADDQTTRIRQSIQLGAVYAFLLYSVCR